MIPGWLNSQGARAGGAGGVSTPQAAAYFAAMPVKPTGSTLKALDALVAQMVKDGTWAKMRYLHLLAIHDAGAAIINAVDPKGQKGTFVGSGFTPLKGFVSKDDNSTYFDPGIVVKNTDPSGFSWGFWGTDVNTATSNYVIGAYEYPCYLMLYSGSTAYFYLGTNSYVNYGPPTGNSLRGFVSMSYGASVAAAYVNGVKQTDSMGTPGTALTYNCWIGRASGSNGSSINARFLMDFSASTLTASEMASFYAALDTYFKAIGAY